MYGKKQFNLIESQVVNDKDKAFEEIYGIKLNRVLVHLLIYIMY